MQDLEFTSERLELELAIENYKAQVISLTQRLFNRELEVGRANTEKLKLQGRINVLNDELTKVKKDHIEIVLLDFQIEKLVSILIRMRKFSQNEAERQELEEFVKILSKINGNKKTK